MRNSRGILGSLSGGIFLIGLALAFFFSSQSDGNLFLPILFVTLGFTSLLGAASSGKANGLYGGIQGFAWFAGLALCFYFGFWPWILVVIGVSTILGALIKPITEGLVGLGLVGLSAASRPQQQYQQYQPNQQPYQPYQEGYQPPAPQPAETYQEGGQSYQYPAPQQPYQQPEVQYPQQELPPQQ